MFAPSVGGDVAEEIRKVSLGAMTNLSAAAASADLPASSPPGLAKLAKNVAAEASNFLMDAPSSTSTLLRAADLLGMDRRTAEMFAT